MTQYFKFIPKTIYLVFGILLGWFFVISSAYAVLNSEPVYKCWNATYQPYFGNSPENACLNFANANFNRLKYTGITVDPCGVSTCVLRAIKTDGSSYALSGSWLFVENTCPENSSLVGDKCICDSNNAEAGGHCVSSEQLQYSPFYIDLESAVAISGAILMLLTVAWVIRILRKAIENTDEGVNHD